MDDLSIAVQKTTQGFKPGVSRLAELMGVGYQVLINKCNPESDHHKLTLREARSIMLHTEDRQMLDVLAADFACDVVPRIAKGESSILDAVLRISSEQGDLAAAIQEALEDNHLSKREKSEVSDKITGLIQSLYSMHTTIQESPAHLHPRDQRG